MTDLIRTNTLFKSWMAKLAFLLTALQAVACCAQESSFTFNTVASKTQHLVIPLGSRQGIEYIETEGDLSSYEISFYTERKANFKSSSSYSLKHHPAQFRVTLKGYSLFEATQDKASFFSLDRAKERNIRKPQIMISFTKRF
ncbi:hypothetical protein [Pleionea sp. CnH1-48]|uniref:hypothetical protein n=1 Tax=Pleionea sp. CnH1-48 TaxID=2954494 RepID=UPI0020984109|nr:hypothetical protein [Pleionea sp. CnH1-48]MCO7227275.1 hypothetical protein [Pleionea sp. CnH1-48]